MANDMDAGSDLDRLIAERLFGWTGLGYYGPPEDGSPWLHKQSVRYDTPEEAEASYLRLYGPTKDNLGLGQLCHWKEDWGPLAVPDWSTDTYDALSLLDDWQVYEIHRYDEMYAVVLYEPPDKDLAAGAYAETLALAICRARLKAGPRGEHRREH